MAQVPLDSFVKKKKEDGDAAGADEAREAADVPARSRVDEQEEKKRRRRRDSMMQPLALASLRRVTPCEPSAYLFSGRASPRPEGAGGGAHEKSSSMSGTVSRPQPGGSSSPSARSMGRSSPDDVDTQ